MFKAVLGKAVVAGAAFALIPAFAATKPAETAKAASPAAKAGPAAAKTKGKATAKDKATAKAEKVDTTPGPLADFGKVDASDDVVHVANWVSYTRNNRNRDFVVIDKKHARMYVFDAKGKLKSDAPVLLGKAVGDDSAPGVGDKPLSQLKDEEKTTPAGRFLASHGRNTHGADILWIDYKAAVSMHRVIKVGDENRFERLASPEIDDNRISNGCVNVPIAFYNSVLKPSVGKKGAYVYVLPETRSVQKVFGSFDVTAKASGTQSADAKPASTQQ
ncbi:hypothetical protein [Ramlibacter albus]|uniref:L,D-TPase catalytic domain-containing protein n=1 Tax=Ramlibacter albus TaxID=2079448 RepID=A0A923S4F9_9BURK|nr:hypothetical protein [Ramlibacter albus]MBC5764092.1 hypothetical protein [Ramlibacter albus]